MSAQLSFFAPARLHDGVPRAYVTQGTERPADLPRLRESAATMERRVLEWFRSRKGPMGYAAFTPCMVACGLVLKTTTVRPRITQLVKSGHLERCAWLPRRPTEDGGSEGWFRYREDVTR